MNTNATSVDEAQEIFVAISDDEYALTKLLKQRRSISDKQNSDIERFKIELFNNRNKYTSFIYSDDFMLLKKKQQDKVLKRLQTISVMYSEACVEWDKRVIKEYHAVRRRALCV